MKTLGMYGSYASFSKAMLPFVVFWVLVWFISCSEAPFQPTEPTPEQITIDSLQTELERLQLTASRWAYIAQCNAEWFNEHNIDPPCLGGI